MAIILQAFGFTISHGLGLTVWGYTDLALYAIAAGWLAITTGGLEVAIALPIAWNGGLVAVAFLTIGDPDPTHGMVAVSWQDLTVHLTATVAYAAVTRLGAYHRRVAVTVTRSTEAIPTSRTKEETR
jgi:hypothetical protein